MQELIVIYDKEKRDRGRDSYIRAIKKQIPGVRVADVANLPEVRRNKLLILKPMNDGDYETLKTFFEMQSRPRYRGLR